MYLRENIHLMSNISPQYNEVHLKEYLDKNNPNDRSNASEPLNLFKPYSINA